MVKNLVVKENDSIVDDFEQTKIYFHKYLDNIENQFILTITI